MAEVAVPRALFCEILERISRLTLVAVTPGAGYAKDNWKTCFSGGDNGKGAP